MKTPSFCTKHFVGGKEGRGERGKELTGSSGIPGKLCKFRSHILGCTSCSNQLLCKREIISEALATTNYTDVHLVYLRLWLPTAYGV